MSNLPLVSVIMPCYNTANYVIEAIKSVQDQTYQNFEIIAIDDGSTDNTVEVLKSLQEKDKRITVLEQEHSNAAKARINAEKHAKGKYLLFLDSDDKIHPEFLEKCLAVAESDENIAFVYTGIQHFDRINLHYCPHYPSLKELLMASHICVTSLMRRSVYQSVGGFDPEIICGEDWELYIRILKAGYDFKLINEPIFYYRKRNKEDSVCDQITEKECEDAFLNVYFKHQETYHENDIFIYKLSVNKSNDLMNDNNYILQKARYLNKRKKYSNPWMQLYYRIFKPKKYQRILKEYNLE